MPDRTARALELAAADFAEFTGSCPLDMYDVEPGPLPCEGECGGEDRMAKCWVRYWLDLAAKEAPDA